MSKDLFEHLKKLNKIQTEAIKENREEKICDEAYQTGFENGRKYERQEIAMYLVEKP